MKETNERTENEKDKCNGNGKEKKKKTRGNGEKKFYLYTAIACATALLAIVITAVAVTNTNQVDKNVGGVSDSTTSDSTSGAPEGEKPVVVVPEGMILPISSATAENDYGFYYNQSVGAYYVHEGVDFVAAAGTEVLASEDGVIESVYKDDLLLGTEIVIDHGDGLKTVYRFVTETEGLKVGAAVEKGDVIATVAEANGNEYKEGAHLHFEVLKNGESIDPTEYLTLEEK